MTTIKNILFDLGKVLLDFDTGIIEKRFRKYAGVENEMVRRAFILHKGTEFESGGCTSSEFHRRMNEELHLNISFEEFKTLWSDIFREIPEMINLFHHLRNTYRTYITSNTDPLHFNFIIGKYSWITLFDGYAVSYELGVRKPEKDFFIKTMKLFDLKPEECVYLDDIEENVLSAETLGIKAIHHISPDRTMERLEGLGINCNRFN